MLSNTGSLGNNRIAQSNHESRVEDTHEKEVELKEGDLSTEVKAGVASAAMSVDGLGGVVPGLVIGAKSAALPPVAGKSENLIQGLNQYLERYFAAPQLSVQQAEGELAQTSMKDIDEAFKQRRQAIEVSRKQIEQINSMAAPMRAQLAELTTKRAGASGDEAGKLDGQIADLSAKVAGFDSMIASQDGFIQDLNAQNKSELAQLTELSSKVDQKSNQRADGSTSPENEAAIIAQLQQLIASAQTQRKTGTNNAKDDEELGVAGAQGGGVAT